MTGTSSIMSSSSSSSSSSLASPSPASSSSSTSSSSLSSSPNKNTKMFRNDTSEGSKVEDSSVLLNAISSVSSIACSPPSSKFTNKLVQRESWPICDGWFCLALLGVSTALCSLTMEFTIEQLQKWHITTYDWVDELESDQHHVYTFIVWTGYAVVLIMASAIVAHYFSPQTIGSGIPEMKTILRGFMLKEYLSFRTLILKMIGLTLSLGSGLPLGKEGPFVHVASALASQLSRFMTGLQGVYVNESRSQEMLAAGCAVGVACTFSTPIGGVLFSIEVTSTYFAVRNYWMGFFAAVCAASTFRIVRFIVNASSVTVEAYYQTRFPEDAFYPEELPIFGLIGLVCGLAGALFIKCHRALLIFLNNSPLARKFLEKYWLLYPILISFITSSITYPKGFGQFLSGEHKFSQTLRTLLSNCTWSASLEHENCCPQGFLDEWTAAGNYSAFVALFLFSVTFFMLSILSSTLAIPAGIFMPVFVIGASFGRLVGELMAMLFPNGIRSNRNLSICPGIYAVVGAASFGGSVTHTISVAVIVFEITGQLMHILPVMIAVFVGNIVCSFFQPSIYDSIIVIKKLPYIPYISHCSHDIHTTTAEQIMISDVKFIWKDITYRDLKKIIDDNREIRAFPVVLDRESRILLGSVSRRVLSCSLECMIGERARQLEAARRMQKLNLSENTRNFSNAVFGFGFEQKTPLLFKNGSDRSMTHTIETNTVNVPSTAFECVYSKQQKDSLGGVLHRSMNRLVNNAQMNVGVIDLQEHERDTWETEQLSKSLDIHSIHIDAAPFQIVENTSIFKIHSVFSLLGLQRAYVTKLGRLVGVVSLREIRNAVENINNSSQVAISSVLDGNEMKNEV